MTNKKRRVLKVVDIPEEGIIPEYVESIVSVQGLIKVGRKQWTDIYKFRVYAIMLEDDPDEI